MREVIFTFWYFSSFNHQFLTVVDTHFALFIQWLVEL